MSIVLRDKEGWSAWVNEVPANAEIPADRAAYEKLTPQQREHANEYRRDYNARPVVVTTAAMLDIQRELRTTLRLNRHAPPGARSGMVVDGDPTVGKTTLLTHLGRRYERELRHNYPQRFADPAIDHQPVVYLTLPAVASPKSLALAFCEYLNIPTRLRDTQADLTRRLLVTLEQAGTDLIMVDDLHFLDLSNKDGRFANDYLKELANSCSATFLYAGVELGRSTLFNEGAGQTRDTQTSGRFSVYRLDPFTVDSKDAVLQWVQTIKAMEDRLVLYQHEPETLARKDWRYLHERTRGRISSLSNLIRRAADRAVEDGSEAITIELLETLTSDLTTQRHFKATAKQPKKSRTRTA